MKTRITEIKFSNVAIGEKFSLMGDEAERIAPEFIPRYGNVNCRLISKRYYDGDTGYRHCHPNQLVGKIESFDTWIAQVRSDMTKSDFERIHMRNYTDMFEAGKSSQAASMLAWECIELEDKIGDVGRGGFDGFFDFVS